MSTPPPPGQGPTPGGLTPPSYGAPVPPQAMPPVGHVPGGGPAPAGAWRPAPRPPHAPGGDRRRRFGHLLSVHPTRDTLLTAAIAVGALIVVKFVVAFIQLIGNAIAYSPTSYTNGFLESPIGLFLGSLVLYPFFFYLAAFVLLTVAFPIVRHAPLPTILGRAIAAGAGGTVVLAVVGIVTGISLALSSGDWVAVPLYVLFIPLAAGVQLTAVLVGGAVVAWLWLGRQAPSGGAQDPQRQSASRPASAASPASPAPAGAPGNPGAAASAVSAPGPGLSPNVASPVAPDPDSGEAPQPGASRPAPPADGGPVSPLPPPDPDDISRFAPPPERH